MHLREGLNDMRDVYSGYQQVSSPANIYGLCHKSESDRLLLCTFEKGPNNTYAAWLVALSRLGSEWREATRMKIDDKTGHLKF